MTLSRQGGCDEPGPRLSCPSVLRSGRRCGAPASPRPSPPPEDGGFEETSQVVAVEVPVNVVDRDGKPVRGLTADDFEVFDDGERQKITGFEVVDLETLDPAEPGGRPAAPAWRRSCRSPGATSCCSSTSPSPRPTVDPQGAAGGARLPARRRSIPPTWRRWPPTRVEHGPQLVVTFTPDRAQLARAIDTLGMQPRLSRTASSATPCASWSSRRSSAQPDVSPPAAADRGPDLKAQQDQAALRVPAGDHQRGRARRAQLRAQPHLQLHQGPGRHGQDPQLGRAGASTSSSSPRASTAAPDRPHRPDRARRPRKTTSTPSRGRDLDGRQRPALRQHRAAGRHQPHAGGVQARRLRDPGGGHRRPARRRRTASGRAAAAARRPSSTWPTRPAASCSRTPTTWASQLERVLRAHQRHLPADLRALGPQARRRLPPAAGQGEAAAGRPPLPPRRLLRAAPLQGARPAGEEPAGLGRHRERRPPARPRHEPPGRALPLQREAWPTCR